MTDTTTAAEHTKESIGDTPIGADPNAPGFEVKYGEYHVPVSQLPPAAIAYLLQNGFSQSMTDAAALTKEQKHHKAPDGSEPGTLGEPLTDAELEAKVKALRDARFARILAGTVAVRAGVPRAVSAIEQVMRQVATEQLRTKLGAKGIVLPSGKNKDGSPKTLTVSGKAMTRDELIVAYIAKNDAAVRAEAERRIATTKEEAATSAELDEMLG